MAERSAISRAGLNGSVSDLRRCFPKKAVAPLRPARSRVTGEQLQPRRGAAGLDHLVELVRLAAVLAFARQQQVRHAPAGRQGPRVPPRVQNSTSSVTLRK